jgi:glucokinase
MTPLRSGATPGLGAGSAVLAFDVGGTDTKAALIDDDGRVRDIARVTTPVRETGTEDAVLDQVASLAQGFRDRHPSVVPRAAGLLVPGYVDEESGIGIFSENLGWANVPFRSRASALLRMPVAFGHDVRGAGEAEYRLGAAAPFRNVVVMAIGTGIAGAIFIDGTAYLGGGLAGEMGHSIVADGPACACGGRGCLEAVASAGAIARRYNALTGSTLPGAREVLDLVQRGNPDAISIWESALDALALDLSHTVALLAPEAIVIGGGLANAGEHLFAPLRQRLDALLTFHRRPVLVAASIGENAGVIGAALKARDLAEAAG